MGFRAQVKVFYGMDFGAEQDEADAGKFNYGSTDPEQSETTPAALRYWGGAKEGVEVITYGHHDYVRIGLALAGSVKRCTLGPLELNIGEPTADELAGEDTLRTYCEKHGLTPRPCRWWAVPYYG